MWGKTAGTPRNMCWSGVVNVETSWNRSEKRMRTARHTKMFKGFMGLQDLIWGFSVGKPPFHQIIRTHPSSRRRYYPIVTISWILPWSSPSVGVSSPRVCDQQQRAPQELESALERAEWEKPRKPAAKKMPMPKKMPESLQRLGKYLLRYLFLEGGRGC